MNDDRPDAQDDDLHAFVDGALPPEQWPALLERLRERPEELQRLRAWQQQQAGLRRLARETSVGDTPAAITATVLAAARHSQRARRARHLALAASWLLAAAVGLGVGLRLASRGTPGLLTRADTPGFVLDARVAHAVFVPDKRHPVEVAAADEDHLVQWLSRRLGTPLRVPSLQAQGFHLLGGRLLSAGVGPRAQFMYEDGRGRRLTLYVAVGVELPHAAPTAFQWSTVGDNQTFYWVDGQLGYALSAALSRPELEPVARAVYEQLQAR